MYEKRTILNIILLAISVATSFAAAFIKSWFHIDAKSKEKSFSFTYGLRGFCEDNIHKCWSYDDVPDRNLVFFEIQAIFYVLVIAGGMNGVALLASFFKLSYQKNQSHRKQFYVISYAVVIISAFAFGMHLYLSYRLLTMFKTSSTKAFGMELNVSKKLGYFIAWLSIVFAFFPALGNSIELQSFKKARANQGVNVSNEMRNYNLFKNEV